MLHLCPHTVQARSRTHSRVLYTAADMEGHLGTDGRFYLLDCARAMPPTAPRVGEHPSRYLSYHFRFLSCVYVFQNLMIFFCRPEAMRRWTGPPLSPDAFSNFKAVSPEETRRNNQNVVDATRWVETQLVAECAKVWKKKF